ncbi:hypothetical protein C8Q74DRAFT_1215043 [Fomes fomentarius]|nr:hypothetical protein C8Q74DRAFT_1215043 [Fomes fomentarius]
MSTGSLLASRKLQDSRLLSEFQLRVALLITEDNFAISGHLLASLGLAIENLGYQSKLLFWTINCNPGSVVSVLLHEGSLVEALRERPIQGISTHQCTYSSFLWPETWVSHTAKGRFSCALLVKPAQSDGVTLAEQGSGHILEKLVFKLGEEDKENQVPGTRKAEVNGVERKQWSTYQMRRISQSASPSNREKCAVTKKATFSTQCGCDTADVPV